MISIRCPMKCCVALSVNGVDRHGTHSRAVSFKALLQSLNISDACSVENISGPGCKQRRSVRAGRELTKFEDEMFRRKRGLRGKMRTNLNPQVGRSWIEPASRQNSSCGWERTNNGGVKFATGDEGLFPRLPSGIKVIALI